MGRDLENILRSAGEGGADLWHQARARMVADASDAYQRGRQAYEDAIRKGQNVAAQTPSQVARLGRAANATVRAFGNSASLGAADPLEAGTEALFGVGGPGNLRQRYDRQLALQHRADADAQREFPNLYRWSGRTGALGGMVAAGEVRIPGAIAKAVPAVGRAVRAVQSTRRIGFVAGGLGRMGAAGGATVGATGQFVADASRGQVSSPADLLDAAAGGAVSGYEAARGRPIFGSAVGSGLTTGLQDSNRGVWSPDNVLTSAQAGAYAGRVFDAAGRFGSNALPRPAKGVLGEGLTFAKSWARGEPIPPIPMKSQRVAVGIPNASKRAGLQQDIQLYPGLTRADSITMLPRAQESKFGAYGKPTKPQLRATATLPNYFFDHWLPSDAGALAAGWFGPPVARYVAGGGGSQ